MKRKDIIDEQFARQAFKLASKASPDTLSKIAKYGKAGLTGLGKAVDIVNPFKSPVKKALGATGLATGYEYLKDPNAPIGTLVARGAKDVGDVAGKVLGWAAEKGAKFAGDFAKGLTEPDTDTKVAGKDKKEPEAARPSDDGVKQLPTRGIGFDELRENPAYQKVLSKYDSFLKEDIDDAFMDAIKGAESGGRNIKNIAGSNAYGHYQFLPDTAKNMAKDPRNRNTPIYGKSWEEFKQDPKLQREFMKVATQDYKNTLAANKIPVTGGTMYMVHHFGPSKAVKMYQAGPNAKMSDFYPEYIKNRRGETVPNPVYTQNPALKPNQTVQHTHDRLDNIIAKKDKTNTLATLDKKQLWSGGTTVAQNVPSTTSIKPTVPAATDQSASISTEPTRAPLIPPTQVAAIDSPKSIPTGTTPGFDYEALRQAVKRGEDVTNTDRFLVPTGKTAALSEAYQHFKLQEQTPSRGTVGAELARTSGGQFATRADRLDQAKVDAALGPGFRAGSREANLALAQKFRTQQPQPDQSVQGAKPSVISAIANPAPISSKFSSAADAAGLATLGTAGVSLAKGAATPVLAKVGGAATKALPVLGGAFMAADAARRYDLGDTTGAAISAAGVHPALALPAVGIQAIRDKYRTGSFFPDDEELKTVSALKLKEGSATTNKKPLNKKLVKLEESKRLSGLAKK